MFLWLLKDGEVILEPQGGPVCQRQDPNLQVSLMTSCIWFGSRPNPKREETVSRRLNSFMVPLALLFNIPAVQ